MLHSRIGYERIFMSSRSFVTTVRIVYWFLAQWSLAHLYYCLTHRRTLLRLKGQLDVPEASAADCATAALRTT